MASVLTLLIAAALALALALGLGVAAYALTSPSFAFGAMHSKTSTGTRAFPSAELIFFSIFSMSYLLWATLPLTVGSSRQFDPGNLLLYPINLRKLFLIDLLSEVASIPSLFAVSSMLAVGIGAGLGQKSLAAGMFISLCAAAFGLVLSKWISTSITSLFRKRKTAGESLLAVISVAAGVCGVLAAQVAPFIFHRIESVTALRWTPPGVVAFALTHDLRPNATPAYSLAVIIIAAYTIAFSLITYWLVRRSVLGGGALLKRKITSGKIEPGVYTGWQLPLLPASISSIVEKELRYLMRNAQVRMMTAMPLLLILIRVMNRRRFAANNIDPGAAGFFSEVFRYGEGLMATGGLLYVFLVLSGISCNLFAFEYGGMRTFVLSPIDRRYILIGKNIATLLVTLAFSVALFTVNELVFGDLTWNALLFALVSFCIYAPLMSVMGNSVSIRFPKRMKFGRRFNISGAAALLLIPIILILAILPIAAVAAGFVAHSLLVEYATLAFLAVLSVAFYFAVIRAQGELLQQREVEILEAVTDPGND